MFADSIHDDRSKRPNGRGHPRVAGGCGIVAAEGHVMTISARIVNPQYLVETDWLAAHLRDPGLRIFDCTTYLDPDPVTVYVARSGRPEWEKGHIPGADYLDLQGELSD